VREKKEQLVVSQNIKMAVKGSTLTITIDLKKSLGLSQSGKNTLIAKAGGNILIPGAPKEYETVRVGLNVYKPVS
jgi:hypothetical protein